MAKKQLREIKEKRNVGHPKGWPIFLWKGGPEMKIKVGDTTYTSIKEKSPAWYTCKAIQAIGFIIGIITIIALAWALTAATILILG